MTKEEQLIKEAKMWEDAYCAKVDSYHMLEIHAASLREQLEALKKENEGMKKLLSDLEEWESWIIGDNECWEPNGMASFPTLTSKIWERMIELQPERNKFIHPQPPK